VNPILTLETLAGRAAVVSLSGGDTGTEQTIAAIRNLVDEALRDPYVRQAAGWIVRSVPAYKDAAEVRAVYEWVKSRIRFTKDPIGKETLSSARWVLTHGFGDCDDINAVLLPSLLGALGYPTQLVTVSLNPNDAGAFSHVYAEVFVGGRWIPLDAARPGATFGSAPTNHFRKRVWSLTDASYQDMRGLNGDFRPLGFDWGSFIDRVSQSVTNIVTALRTPPQYLPTYTQTTSPYYPQTPSGISSNTMLLLGAAAIGVVLLAGKK